MWTRMVCWYDKRKNKQRGLPYLLPQVRPQQLEQEALMGASDLTTWKLTFKLHNHKVIQGLF